MSSTQPSISGNNRRETNINANENQKPIPEKGQKPEKIAESSGHPTKGRLKNSKRRPSSSSAKPNKSEKCGNCGGTPHSKSMDAIESDDSSTSESDENYSAKSHGSDSTDTDSETESEGRRRETTRSRKSAAPRRRFSVRTNSMRRGNRHRSRSNSIAGREADYQQYSDVDDGHQYVQPRQSQSLNGQNYSQYVQSLEQRCSQLQFQVDQASDRGSGFTGGYFPSQAPPRPLVLDYSSGPPTRGPIHPRGGGFIPGPPRSRHIQIQRGGARRSFSQRAQYASDNSYLSGEENDPGAHKHTKFRPGTKLEYKRVDWVWDKRLYTFKLQDTAEIPVNSEYDEYIFHIRRTFDSENKHRATFVDIKSKLLRECLQDVIGNVRGFNLVDETPKIDPNLLFLYLEDFRAHLKQLKKMAPAGSSKKERKKNKKRLEDKRKQLKVLVKYLDKDYAKVKDSLYPMLKSGIITFDFLWALWKPNTLVYSASDDTADDPRVYKVSFAGRASTILSGSWYFVEGKCLEFDGNRFGHGTLAQEVQEFQGTRKITSLPVYPLKYHKDEANVRQALVERGKKFVELAGAHFKAYAGVACMKRKKGSVVKFHIQQSRIMIDPATFRRVNPNYFLSPVRARDYDDLSDSGMDDDEIPGYEQFSSDDDEKDRSLEIPSTSTNRKKLKVTKALKNEMEERAKKKKKEVAAEADKKDASGSLPTDSSGEEEKQIVTPQAETISDETLDFSDEDYLISSPVVLGFAFSEKQWLEFSVSKVEEIKWNDTAWDSLVLEPETKDLIQALVKSRRHHASQTIDDVIQGKGKGLVTVLHGPPGTGKTLTAEGISELLKCPLYMASAGELGTDPRFLEADLQKILDICHAWGAILLLDEADVFLEKRNMQDIHRNALVSIFLRQLEYFQGILFLTTNRVETFDDAFQSRIHIALRYENLDAKAKKTIFKMFIDRVEAHGKLTVQPFTDDDLNKLAKHELNGREIKNMVGSAQDLAVTKGEALSMAHIQQVLDIHVKFGRDLKGGTGYEEAMRSYC